MDTIRSERRDKRGIQVVQVVCLVVTLFLFSSKAQDIPFFAMDTGSTVDTGCIPTNIAAPTYYWVNSDLAANSAASVWTDRYAGFQIVQTNSLIQPTNSANGLCFDGHSVMSFSNTMMLPTGSSVFVVLNASPTAHNMVILQDTNIQNGLYITPNAQYRMSAFANSVAATDAVNPTNLLTFAFTTQNSGGQTKFTFYTNGVPSATNNVATLNPMPLDCVGGIANVFNQTMGRLDYSFYGFIREIVVWTNLVLSPATNVCLNTYAGWKYSGGSIDPWFNPYTVSGLTNWVRSDNPTIGANAGGPVTNGTPASFFGDSKNDGVQGNNQYWGSGNAGTGPIWNSDTGPNGKPSFNNGANTLITAFKGVAYQGSAYSMLQPNTFFVLLKQTNTTGSQVIQDSGYAGNRNEFYRNSGLKLAAGATQTLPDPYSFTNWTILTVCFNGASSWARTNGVALGTVSGSVGTFSNPVSYLGDQSTGGFQFKGFISEYFLFNEAVATNDIAKVENYLMNKWDPNTNIWVR